MNELAPIVFAACAVTATRAQHSQSRANGPRLFLRNFLIGNS
jgi:hypothetical protein